MTKACLEGGISSHSLGVFNQEDFEMQLELK